MFSAISSLLSPRSSDPSPISEPGNPAILVLFFTFQLFGLAGLFIILLTAAITRTWKHPTWVNFCVSWIISCISYSLLVGRPLSYVPPHQLCLTQAVLIYTVPTLTASATLALVIHVFMMIRYSREGAGKALTIVLVVLPYLAASGMMAMSLAIALGDPQTVRRTKTGLYCNMGNEIPGKISAGVVTLVMLVCIILEVLTSRDLKRKWSVLRAGVSTGTSNSRTPNLHSNSRQSRGTSRHSRDSRASTQNLHISPGRGTVAEEKDQADTASRMNMIALTLKVLAFSVFSVFAVGLGIVFTFTPHQAPALNLVLALIPATAVLVFGAQRDLLLAWASGFRRIRDFSLGRKHCTSSGRMPWKPCHANTESQEKMVPVRPSRSPLEDC